MLDDLFHRGDVVLHQADGFLLQRLGAGGTFPPSGLLLGRPFVNPAIDPLFGNPETALLLASNGLFTGGASVSTSNTFWGVELNGRFGLTGNSWYRADLLAGFRYVSLGEGLNVGSTVTALPDGLVTFQGSPVLAPASVAVLDSFRTRNDFYGAQIGTVVEFQKGMWFADWRALLAAGVVRQSLTISGATSLITPTDITTVPGGLLAQASNIGRFARNEFGIVPETGLSVGCQVASFLRVYAGYSVLYMRQDVLRPGTSIDRSVQVTQIPSLSPAPTGTETLPGVILRNVDYWVQGVHFGVELTF